ncbi:MAG: 50S ribosomal protein L21 [Chlamydiales bacterium]|nr:50S ribosomal protein L21 [Chlamydiales bacterium]
MYAIIETGGKQYRIQKGDIIDVALLGDEKEVTFSSVLLIQDGSNIQMGAPYVAKSSVTAQVLGIVKGPKVISFKIKKRKNSRRKVGHRQHYSRVQITDIVKGEK